MHATRISEISERFGPVLETSWLGVASGDYPVRRGRRTQGANIAPLRSGAAHAAREGFIVGFNDVMRLGALLCIGGAFLALCLVRERDLERQPLAPPPGQPARAR